MAERIHEYHRRFGGDTYDACSRCGGRCEKCKTSTLVPGEKRYLAARLGLDVAELERTHLDRLDTPYGRVDVIRLDSACPFLGADKRCSIAKMKPVLCDCYPIVILPARGRPRFGIDRRGCPMTRWAPYRSCIDDFLRRGVPALEGLRLPPRWLRIVALYDDFDFDCAAIRRGLGARAPRGPVMVEELLAFTRGADRRKARSRGLALLAVRLASATDRGLAALSRRATASGAPRPDARAYAAALRRKSIAARRALAEARRDDALLSGRATRYLGLVRMTRETIQDMSGDARRFARRLDRRAVSGSPR